MALEADAVARPVDELRRRSPPSAMIAAGDRVDRLARDARADRGGRLGLGACRTLVEPRNSASGPCAASPPVTQTVRVMSEP